MPTPRNPSSAAASAPTPNQRSTKPGVKTSATIITTPKMAQTIHEYDSISLVWSRHPGRTGRQLTLEHILHHEPNIGGPLGQPPHEVRIPVFAVRNVDPHAISVAGQLDLQVAADPV